MKIRKCAVAVLLVNSLAFAQETPRKAYELLVGCSVSYAKLHPSTRLTASELSDAAVASCDAYASKVRELAYQAAKAGITSSTSQALPADEIERAIRKNSEDIRADAIAKARKEVLQALAEQ